MSLPFSPGPGLPDWLTTIWLVLTHLCLAYYFLSVVRARILPGMRRLARSTQGGQRAEDEDRSPRS